MFTAEEIMTVDVVVTTPDDTIEDVVELIERHQISGLPVVDERWGVVGVISEFDLLRGISTGRMRGRVADFMQTDVVTVEEDATLVDLAELFLTRQVRRVPVAREGRLVGVISRRDLIFAGHVRQELLDLPVDNRFAQIT